MSQYRKDQRSLVLACVLVLVGASAYGQDRLRDSAPARTDILPDSAVPPIEVLQEGQILNRGRLPIIAISGTFEYPAPSGELRTVAWTHNFASSLLIPGRGLQPESAFRFPPTQDRNTGQEIPYLNVKVDGVLTSDGRAWGEKGGRLRANCTDEARASRITLRQALDAIREHPQEWLEEALASDEPFALGPYEEVVHLTLRSLLYDRDTKTLKADPESVIQGLIDRLGQF